MYLPFTAYTYDMSTSILAYRFLFKSPKMTCGRNPIIVLLLAITVFGNADDKSPESQHVNETSQHLPLQLREDLEKILDGVRGAMRRLKESEEQIEIVLDNSNQADANWELDESDPEWLAGKEERDVVMTKISEFKATIAERYTDAKDQQAALKSLEKVQQDVRKGKNVDLLMTFQRSLDLGRAVVDNLNSETVKDVAVGVASIVQIGLMVAVPPPFGSALGCFAGMLGGLMGRGGSMRLGPMIKGMITEKLKEARFDELEDKAAGAQRTLETVHTYLKGMSEVDKGDWTDNDINNVGNQAKVVEGVDVYTEMESHINRLKTDPANAKRLLVLVEAYANLCSARSMMLNMMMTIYRLHGLQASIKGITSVIESEKVIAKDFLDFLASPTQNEALIPLLIREDNQTPLVKFLEGAEVNLFKDQISLIGKCYIIKNRDWPNWYLKKTQFEQDDGYNYYYEVVATDELYSLPSVRDRKDIHVINSSKPGYVEMRFDTAVQRTGSERIGYSWGERVTVLGETFSHLRLTNDTAKAQFRLVKMKDNHHWLMSAGSCETPLQMDGAYVTCGEPEAAVEKYAHWNLEHDNDCADL